MIIKKIRLTIILGIAILFANAAQANQSIKEVLKCVQEDTGSVSHGDFSASVDQYTITGWDGDTVKYLLLEVSVNDFITGNTVVLTEQVEYGIDATGYVHSYTSHSGNAKLDVTSVSKVHGILSFSVEGHDDIYLEMLCAWQ